MSKVRALAFLLVIGACGLGIFSIYAAAQATIQDPAEYNAYIAALNETDPAKKAASMEAFLEQYPQSVVKVDALEQAMAAYQQLAETEKVADAARRILKLQPEHVRGLAILTYIERAQAASGDKAVLKAALKEACAYAETGSRLVGHWRKPEDMSDSDFKKLRNQVVDIFYGALGNCALQNKDYPAAREALTKAVELDATNLQDVYLLAVADLQMRPLDVRGFWYCARAINLARSTKDTAVLDNITPYCQASYKKYHGGVDGWEQVVADVASEESLPDDFAVKTAPTPADFAVAAVRDNAPEDLSFSDKEFILSFRDASPANKDAADKVWASIQTLQKNGAARLSIPVKVISSTSDSIDAAISEDNQAADRADLHVVMEKPMLNPPPADTELNIIGVITGYTPQPFMFTMAHGSRAASSAR